MRTRLQLAFPLIVISLVVAGATQRGGHTVFGDLSVDDSKVEGIKPETFQLVLYDSRGQEIGRQMVMSKGRYRFLGLSNGEYDIGVQVEQQEIARIHLHLMELQSTEIRKDIELQWRPARTTASRTPPATVSAGGCNQSPANEELFNKAGQQLKKKNYDTAITLLNQIVSADPKDCAAWTELGTAHFRRGSLEEAEKSYQRALGERPSFLPALINLGKLRLARKNFEGAIETLSLALKAQPQSAEANFLVGEAYLQIKKGSKAVGYLNEALRLDPIGEAEAHLRLAALYNGAGLKEKAATEYEQFLSKRPDYPERKALQAYIKANKKP
ncbi:MAG: tetratricopeptide repeat protein [Blastocatellia bacterium]